MGVIKNILGHLEWWCQNQILYYTCALHHEVHRCNNAMRLMALVGVHGPLRIYCQRCEYVATVRKAIPSTACIAIYEHNGL